MSGSNAPGLGASVGARTGWDGEGVPDIAPPVCPTTAGCLLACARGERRSGVAPAGCGITETTVGGEAEVEVWVDGGREDGAEAEVEAPLLADVETSSGPAVEAACPDSTCPDSVSEIVDAPLSGGAAAIMPAKTSARRKNLLTRAPPSYWISQVSGPWLLGVASRSRITPRRGEHLEVLARTCGKEAVTYSRCLRDESHLGRPVLSIELQDQQPSVPREAPRTGLADDVSVTESLRPERDRAADSKAQV